MGRGVLAAVILAAGLCAQPSRVLYVTHSAGYRHDSIEVSKQVLRSLSPRIEVTATEDLSVLTEEGLRPYSAIFFFTSGELPISPAQKASLLAFVRNGGGFGGVHSATDTLYQWPEYGDLIGAYFEGHPWTQDVRIDVEDPDHPATAHLGPGWSMMDEIYQFRNLRRDRVRVLLTLDMRSVDPTAPGAHRHTTDFPLAWVREYENGRVFYTALGHFDSTWRDRRFQRMLEGALLWLTRQVVGSAAVRGTVRPQIAGVSAGRADISANTIVRGAWASIYGSDLTSGSTMTGGSHSYTLAGTSVAVNGQPALLGYASPRQVNVFIPADTGTGNASLDILLRGVEEGASAPVLIQDARATCSAVSQHGTYLSAWVTGLTGRPKVEARIDGQPASVLFAGPAPQWPEVWQVNVALRQEWAGTERRLELSAGIQSFCDQNLLINSVSTNISGIRAY